MIDDSVPFTAVHASRGKYVRAEPIAALFEQNRVHLVGSFPLLEDELTQFTPDLDRNRSGSPDRADSMIWALSELMVERQPYEGLLQFYENEARLARGEAAK
jgi:phage terminase large subunit-like protein